MKDEENSPRGRGKKRFNLGSTIKSRQFEVYLLLISKQELCWKQLNMPKLTFFEIYKLEITYPILHFGL